MPTPITDSSPMCPMITQALPITGNHGWLEGGINLVDEGQGYYHYNSGDAVDTDDWGTLALVNMIEGGGRDYHFLHLTPRGGFGDMSLQNGGHWPPHSSHQNGLDVDARYVRNDGQEIGINIAGPDSIYYDIERTVDLMNSLFHNADCALIIVSHMCRIEFQNIDVIYDTTGAHDNHFHIRIADPDGTGN